MCHGLCQRPDFISLKYKHANYEPADNNRPCKIKTEDIREGYSVVRCSVCVGFFIVNIIICPCCGSRYRFSPKHNHLSERFIEQRIKRID